MEIYPAPGENGGERSGVAPGSHPCVAERGEGAPAGSAAKWVTKRTPNRKKNKRQKSQNARAC
jgi:hypothetical protein